MTFVYEHRDQFAVAFLLRVLGVGASTYYAWVKLSKEVTEQLYRCKRVQQRPAPAAGDAGSRRPPAAVKHG